MHLSSLRSRVVAVFVLAGLPVIGAAQQPSQLPSPAQAQQLLQNPAVVEQLRQRLATSGLTPDQIRARLRAMGYPENMLDAYIGGASGDSLGTPNNTIYSAVQQLGVVDSTDVSLLRCGINPDSISTDTGSGLPGNSFGMPGTRRPPNPTVVRSLLDRCAAAAHGDTLTTAQQKLRVDSGLVIFGMDFFRRETSQFQPNVTGPVGPDYRLGPGDRLVLILTGDVEQAYTLDVTREGFVVIPQVGEVFVNNLTLAQLNDVLYSRLGHVYSGVRRGADATTHFSVSPARLRSNTVYVTGDVMRPGAYQISGLGTLLTALYAAAGPSDNGTLRGIEVRRGGKLVGTLDFYDYLIHGNSANDIQLENGDVVFVPVHLARVRLVGQITRPGTYETKPGETLADAIHFAGGVTDQAARKRVQMERILPPAQRTDGRDRVTTDIVSDALASGDGPAIAVAPGDVIHVFAVNDRIRNRVLVTGNVNIPGPLGLTPNMTIADALRLAGGVKSDSYLERVLVARVQPDSTRVQLRAALRDTTGAVLQDFPLQENDEIHVFSRTEFHPERYVVINGAIRKSGRYPYREGMSMRDLILVAGGLRQSAYLDHATIARLQDDRSNARTATEFTIPLDSSYLFERGPDGRYAGPPGIPAPKGVSPEVALRPYDNVLILQQPGWDLLQTVAVEGEVRFPGRYTLLHKNERIADLIARAGGLTNEAYADGVTFIRTQDGIGRVGIDLSAALRAQNSRDNLLLRDGDSLLVPRFSSLVLVSGAVNSPVGVTYVPGEDMDYYIRAAGGPSAKADLDRAYVTQPNGKVDANVRRHFRPDHIPRPAPGSKVYVPLKDPLEKPTDALAITSAIATILSGLVAISLAIARL